MLPTVTVKETYTLSEFVIRAKAAAGEAVRTDSYRVDWVGCTFAQAQTFALDGWAEGVRRIRPLASRVADRVASHLEVTDWAHDVEPGNLDVARFIDGEPECWLTPSTRHIAAQGRLLTVIYGGATSSKYTVEEMFRRGSAAVALVDALERAGHSVRLVWQADATESWPRQYAKYRAETSVIIKDWGEALHLGRVAFALSHSAMFRSLYFAIQDGWSREDKERFGVPEGGRGKPAPTEDRPECIVIREMLLGNTPEDLERWVLDQLKKQGIELHEEAER